MRLSPDVPFSPRRVPFFYGWVIVAASTIGVIMSVPGQTVGVSVFTDDLIEATGLTRLSLSTAYLVGTLMSAFLLPLGGKVFDRFGARLTAMGATLLLASTLFYLSAVDRVGAALGGGSMMFVAIVGGFVCLRFSGQGMLTMVSRGMLGKWFNTRRGLATGVSGLFVSFGFASAPLVFSAWITRAGFRGAWREMAIAALVIMGTVAFLLFRDNPELCGLVMDGQEKKRDAGAAQEAIEFTRSRAVRTRAFWAGTLALAFQGLVITGVTFHIVDIGAHVQMDKAEVVAIFLPTAVVSTVVGLVAGVVMDRVRVHYVIIVMMIGQAMALYAIANLASLYWLAVVGMGISGGCFSPISTVAFPRWFGREHLGAIMGFMMMWIVAGSALGPSLFAASERAFGSYEAALYCSLVFPAIVIVLSQALQNPQDAAAS